MEKLTFKNKNGYELSGRIELPLNQKPVAYALFAHCFTCNKNLLAVKNIAKALTMKGIAVMRFDFTGLGDSEGDFADTNFTSNVQDLIAAAEAMSEQYEAPKLIIGHSLGGAAVVFAANQIPSVEAVATIGAPASPDHVSHLFNGSIEEIMQHDEAKVNIGGRGFTVKKQFLDDISSKNMSQVLKELKKPIIILHSPQDNTVGIENAGEIYNNALHPKSFISLDSADHLLMNNKDSLYVGDVIAGWSTRYLTLPKEDELKTNQQVAVQIGRDRYTTDVVAGKHSFRADEPTSVGGQNFGPSPYDLLLASIGTCTAMTLRMYADRKEWDVDEITVHLNHSKDHVKDCEDCTTSSSKIDLIERIIQIDGNIDDTQKKRMLEIADKCPVHKTLHNEVHVKTALKEV